MNKSNHQAREILLRVLSEEMATFGIGSDELINSFDVVDNGLVDSFGFLELISRIEEDSDVELDFEGVNMEELTTVNSILNIISNALQQEENN